MSRKAILLKVLSILKEERPARYPEDELVNRTDQMDEAIGILEQV